MKPTTTMPENIASKCQTPGTTFITEQGCKARYLSQKARQETTIPDPFGAMFCDQACLSCPFGITRWSNEKPKKRRGRPRSPRNQTKICRGCGKEMARRSDENLSNWQRRNTHGPECSAIFRAKNRARKAAEK
jgi:hypothetical protein